MGHISILLLVSFPHSDVQCTVGNGDVVIEEKVGVKAADLEENIIYHMGLDFLFEGKVNEERQSEVLIRSQCKLPPCEGPSALCVELHCLQDVNICSVLSH